MGRWTYCLPTRSSSGAQESQWAAPMVGIMLLAMVVAFIAVLHTGNGRAHFFRTEDLGATKSLGKPSLNDVVGSSHADHHRSASIDDSLRHLQDTDYQQVLSNATQSTLRG